MNYKSYNEMKNYAQQRADETGYDFGIQKLGQEYSVFMLPEKKYRFGRDLKCEVVMCTKLERCEKGHGPNAK